MESFGHPQHVVESAPGSRRTRNGVEPSADSAETRTRRRHPGPLRSAPVRARWNRPTGRREQEAGMPSTRPAASDRSAVSRSWVVRGTKVQLAVLTPATPPSARACCAVPNRRSQHSRQRTTNAPTAAAESPAGDRRRSNTSGPCRAAQRVRRQAVDLGSSEEGRRPVPPTPSSVGAVEPRAVLPALVQGGHPRRGPLRSSRAAELDGAVGTAWSRRAPGRRADRCSRAALCARPSPAVLDHA